MDTPDITSTAENVNSPDLNSAAASDTQTAGEYPIDRQHLDPFLYRLIDAAGATPGCFVIAGFGELPNSDASWRVLPPKIRVIPNDGDAFDAMIAAVEDINRTPGLNAYASIGLFKAHSLWVKKDSLSKGSEADLIGSLAAVGDFDQKHDAATWRERFPLTPHVVEETSAGNFQPWTFLDRPYPPDELKPVLQALATACGSDKTHSCEHVFRLPGTWNWPTEKKARDYGRALAPQRAKLVESNNIGKPGRTLEQLRTAILAKSPTAFDKVERERAEFDWGKPHRDLPPGTLRTEYDAKLVRKLSQTDVNRSDAAFRQILAMAHAGYTPNEVKAALERHSDLPVMGHYEEKGEHAEAAIERDINKVFSEPLPASSLHDAAALGGAQGTQSDGLKIEAGGAVVSLSDQGKTVETFLQHRFMTVHNGQPVRTLLRRQGEWYVWTGTRYETLTDDDMKAQLYGFLNTAVVMGAVEGADGNKSFQERPYLPDQKKVNKVFDALKYTIHHKGDVPSFLPGSDIQMFGGEAREFVAVQNGILGFKSEMLWPHEPQFFSVNTLGFAYDKKATCPLFEGFLRSLFPGDQEAIDTLQEIFGYLVSGETSLEKMFLLHGPGRSGKSTIAHVLRYLMGVENCKSFTFDQLCEAHGMQDFIGKTLLTIKDAHIDTWKRRSGVERMKMMSGNDDLSVPRKYLPDWNGKLSGRILILTNNEPRLDDDSSVIASRIIPIKLNQTFLGKEDHTLLEKKLKPELAGIFNWSRTGWQRLMARGQFIIPASAQELSENLETNSSAVGQFVRDYCLLGPEHEVGDGDPLWIVWKHWCRHNDEQPGTRMGFFRKLRSAVHTIKRCRASAPNADGQRPWGYSGITVRPLLASEQLQP